MSYLAGSELLHHVNPCLIFETLVNPPHATCSVVLWMTGGPGCSSELAVFYENGPYSINHDMSLTETQFGWDRFHTTIFVDQPINTGFSYSKVSPESACPCSVAHEGISNVRLKCFLLCFASEG